ncbi:MAG TPA: cytochrome c oxidase assembly protein [Thermomicrobiales bacterium]|nr:cytochrome c oxidase assembly protein [Thermomicrobiales bacterium]
MTTRMNAVRATPYDGAARDRRIRLIALISAVAVMIVANVPAMQSAVHQSFAMHMVQHVILINIAAPLLSIAWPLVLGRWYPSRGVNVLNRAATPPFAIVLSTIMFWASHYPAVYDFAMTNPITHAIEHAVFIVSFVLFWRPLIPDAMNPGYLKNNGSRVLYLTIGMVLHGTPAVYIMFIDHAIYPHYVMMGSYAGRSPLADQHLGGGVMLLAGTIAMTMAALVSFRDEP